ncbi:MAG: BatA domain-containing protein [Planctomycetota bacterium]
MIEGFQNPGLLAGVALAAVPLIIHLFNRRRFKPQPWAAMRFVYAAYKRTRRRVQLENLLLLLARIAAVALFALAIARPYASGDSPLAALREERRDLVLLVDASASTGYQSDVRTVHAAIRARALELLDDLDGAQGDRARLAFVGERTRLFPWTDPADARSILDALEGPLDEGADLAGALATLADELEVEAREGLGSALEVRFLTDLQESTFRANVALGESDEDAPPPALAEQLERFDALGTTLEVEDLGPRVLRPQNLSVAALTPLGEDPRVGAPFEVAVEVTNHGDQDVLAERVALRVGDERLPSQRVDVPARGSAEATFTVVLGEAGRHALVASLEGDRLGVDDARAHVVDAPPPLRVLVVNGAPAERIEDDEVGFLIAVLEPPTSDSAAAAPYAVTAIGAAEFDGSDAPIDTSDLIVVANVGTLSGSTVERLEARVAAGATLVITAGDRIVDVVRWGRALTGDDGAGLLPAEPIQVVSAPRRTSYYRVAEFDETSAELRYFADESRRPLFTEVPIYDFLGCEPLPGARVLASLSDPRSSPLLVERPFGRGRTVLWTTSIDRAWNRIPDSGKTFVPLVLELFDAIAPEREEPLNVGVGSDLTVTLADFPRAPVLVDPRGTPAPIEGAPTEREDGRWILPALSGASLARAGLFEVRTEDGLRVPIAVHLDAQESDLARATPADVEAIHPALRVARAERDDEPAAERPEAPRSGELWRLCAMLALGFLVFESLWGAYIGSRRRNHA